VVARQCLSLDVGRFLMKDMLTKARAPEGDGIDLRERSRVGISETSAR